MDKTQTTNYITRQELHEELTAFAKTILHEVGTIVGEANRELSDLIDGRINGLEYDIHEFRQGVNGELTYIKENIDDIAGKINGNIRELKWGRGILEYNLRTHRLKQKPESD